MGDVTIGLPVPCPCPRTRPLPYPRKRLRSDNGRRLWEVEFPGETRPQHPRRTGWSRARARG